MPVIITGRLEQVITGIQRKIESPELITELGKSLSEHLANAFYESGLNPESGATVRALSKVGKPEKTGNGWAIGVGDGQAAGAESTPAPRNTLRDFYRHIEGGLEGYAGATGRIWKFTDWWGMSNANKRLLAQGRRAGMFGGRGTDYANYLWIQNRGNSKARISSHGFIESGIASWRAEVPDIIDRVFQERLT